MDSQIMGSHLGSSRRKLVTLNDLDKLADGPSVLINVRRTAEEKFWLRPLVASFAALMHNINRKSYCCGSSGSISPFISSASFFEDCFQLLDVAIHLQLQPPS